MSGTGKSTALEVQARRGHRTVDTDTDQWSRWATMPNGDGDWVWREDATATIDSVVRQLEDLARLKVDDDVEEPCT